MTLASRIRAWKDPLYRASLSEAERQQLPESPAGMIELSGTVLDAVAGGSGKKNGHSKHYGKHSGKHGSKSSKSGKSGKSGKSSKSGKSGSRSGGGSGYC